jgi:hypothetical protein
MCPPLLVCRAGLNTTLSTVWNTLPRFYRTVPVRQPWIRELVYGLVERIRIWLFTVPSRSVSLVSNERAKRVDNIYLYRAVPSGQICRLSCDQHNKYCMFTSEASSGVLRQIEIVYELVERNPRDSVYGPYWTRLGKGATYMSKTSSMEFRITIRLDRSDLRSVGAHRM